MYPGDLDTGAAAVARIELRDPARAVADARRMIDEERAAPGRWGCGIPNSKLPDSLKWPARDDRRDPMRPLEACVEADHVDLIVGKHTDGRVGFRIWSADAKTVHADKPTRYQDVFFYLYDVEAAASPQNVR
jgi:hypothetical protein